MMIGLSAWTLDVVMGEFSIFHLLVVAILAVVLLFNRKIPEAMRPFGEEIIRRKRPPKHPLPVTGPIELPSSQNFRKSCE